MAACCVFFHSFSSPSIFSSRHLPFHLPVGPSICPSFNNLCLPRLQALAHILSFSILVWYLRPSPCLMGGNLSPTRNSLRLSGEGFLGWLLLSLPSVRFRCGLLPSSSPAYPDFSSLTVCAQHGHSTCLTLQVSPDIQLSRVMDGIENILRKLWPRERKLKIYPSVSVFSGFPDGASGKEPTCQCIRCKRCWFDPWVRKILLEKGMATHSSILTWKIPWRENPGGLQSIGSQRVRCNLACTSTFCNIYLVFE